MRMRQFSLVFEACCRRRAPHSRAGKRQLWQRCQATRHRPPRQYL